MLHRLAAFPPQVFVGRRKPRASAISLLSRLASDLIVNFFDTPWSPHDDRGKGILAYLTFAWKPLLQYVVFPLQFLFLYSYHPSGGMGELPKRLEDQWRQRHRAGAEAAFAKAKAEGQAVGKPSFFAKEVAEAAGPKSDVRAAVP
jgi:zeaxanthin epoxidase